MKRLTAKQYALGLLGAYTQSEASQRPIVAQNFFKALVRRRAMKLLPRILSHIQHIQDQAAGLTRVRVWSAGQVEEAELIKQLHAALGAVTVETTTEPNLIGGLRLQVGDRLIDGTLRNRLKRLQTSLKESA